MAVYVVGDLQGCLDPLKRLLDKVDFDPSHDQLWATGDLVNRGNQSLETLRFLKSLGKSFTTVLGNHDLHLLAIHHGVVEAKRKDTFDEILEAHDRKKLMKWLQKKPLIMVKRNHVLVHAGIPHIWNLKDACLHASEVEAALQSDHAFEFFQQMYGNHPDRWRPDIEGLARLRLITNYLTRMRFINKQGELNLTANSSPQNAPKGYKPWFSFKRQCKKPIIFGHWAALQGQRCGKKLYPLDTGYIWGNKMRLMRLEDHKFFHTK